MIPLKIKFRFVTAELSDLTRRTWVLNIHQYLYTEKLYSPPVFIYSHFINKFIA